MKRSITLAAVAVATVAFAENPKDMKAGSMKPATTTTTTANTAAAAPMDMSKMGPWTRKPANEGAVKKEITEFMKKEEELMKTGDFSALTARIDFPVYMATDDASGNSEAMEYSKEKYVARMKPMMDNMPKDMKTSHKANITVLSDAMVVVTDDCTTQMGKQKYQGRSASMLVKKNGNWMWKVMAEPGWGGMSAPGTGGSAPTAPMMNNNNTAK
ncbi:MAG: hypothetical protein ACT4TC_07355 [Myxococcaceae bacterium]